MTYKNFQEMYAHLRGKVEIIVPKEYKGEAEKPSLVSEEKPKRRSRKKKEN